MKNNIEKALKRFLRKNGGFREAILISFLITGSLAYGSDGEIQKNKELLSSEINNTKKEINTDITKLEESKKLKEKEMEELLLEADFWGKPLYKRYQFFFSGTHTNTGDKKDNTKSEFKETIDAVNNFYSLSGGGTVDGYDGEDLVKEFNGVVIDTSVYSDTISIGANVTSLTPELPTINPSVAVDVTTPNIEFGSLPGSISIIQPTLPSVNVTPPSTPSIPNGVTVSVTTPSSVEKIEINTPTISAPTPPNEKVIAVNVPLTPEGFDPKLITPPIEPDEPATPIINLFTPPNITFEGSGFKQPTGYGWPKENIVVQNFDSYTTSGEVDITVVGGVASWSDGLTISSPTNDFILNAGSAPLGFSKYYLNAFISHVDDRDVTVDGTYNFDTVLGGRATKMFASVNPYNTGYSSSSDKTFDFKGTLNITHDVNATYNVVTVGLEHQLLANGAGGFGSYINITSGLTTHILENSGTINLIDGNNMVGIMIDTEYESYEEGDSAFIKLPETINSGVINIGEAAGYSIGIDYGFYESGAPNTSVSMGNINIDGSNSYGVRLKDYSSDNGNYYNLTTLDGSTGTISVDGSQNVGISIGQGRSTGDPTGSDGHSESKDLITNLNVTVGGEENVGFYRNNTIGSGHNTTAMTLDDKKISDFKFASDAQNSTLFRSDLNEIILTKDLNLTAGSTGNSVMQAGGSGTVTNTANLTSNLSTFYGMTAGDFNGSVNATANNYGNITLSGDNSIGIAIASGNTGSNTGNITFEGTSGSGIYNKGTFNLSGGDISIDGDKSTGIYNDGGSINISGAVGITVKNGASGIYSDGGSFTSSTTDLTINVDDTLTSSTQGVGIYSSNGANINLPDTTITVKDGGAGIAAFDAGTDINLTGGTIDYEGDGYAVYSDGDGKVNLSDAKIILGGSGTAFDLDLATTSPITLNSNSEIHVTSDDVVVFNLKNATGLNTSGLESSIETTIGTSLGGMPLSGLVTSDTGIDDYKIAAVDGGTITIGDLDKTGTGVAGETTAQEDGYFYYNRFLGQRLVATANSSTISAVLDNTQDDNFNDQIVGLEMNSSGLATSNAETAINLTNSSTLIADRNDVGAGAIGTFINYGIVDIDGTSSINVEMETSNTANDGGVGVYAVNGSKVSNAGDINVGGAGIGILAMAYREDSTTSTAIVDEFGSLAVDQGKIDVINSGNITLNDDASVGIYAINNSANTANDATITNTGSITVGNSSTTNSAVGIYGNTSTINNTGAITAGDGGVGIYATDNSKITELGTLNLEKDGIGVIVDESTSVASSTVVTVNDTSSGNDVDGKTVLIYQGDSGTPSTGINIDTTNLTNGTAIYVDGQNTAGGMTLTSSGTLSIGDSGVGIYAASEGSGVNSGVIELVQTPGGTVGSKDSVGMYTNDGTIVNDGTIKVLDNSSIGMFGATTNSTLENTGTIDLDVDNTTGIFITDSGSLNLGGSINFNGSESIGVYSEDASTVNLNTSTSFVEDNENSNILVYAKDSTVNNSGTLTVDGVATPTTVGAENNKTVGIYLENDSTGSKYSSISGGVDVSNQAIGIYSKGSNTLEDVNITSKDTGTTGIYLDGGGTINGTITANGTGGIGVYGVDGEVVIGSTGISLNTGASGTTEKGTGIYLTDGAYATGGTITVDNQSTVDNIGLYYAKGLGTTEINHNTDINIIGDEGIGIYAADGINLTNNSDISSSGTTGNIGIFVSEASKYTSNGGINLGGVNELGIYVEDGEATSNGILTLSGTPTSTGTGIGITGKSVVGKTATVNNAGTITANSNLGMYIAGDGSSIGTNTGSIVTTTGTGVYIDGSSTTGVVAFDGSDGTIKSDILGMYLEDTKAGSVTNTGTLDIGVGGVGVYSNGSTVDFKVDTAANNNLGEIALTVGNNSVVDGATINSGTDSVGIFVIDDTVTFNKTGTTTNTVTTNGNNTGTSVGIYLGETVGTVGSEYTLSNIDVDAKDGIGIYLGDDGTVGSNVKFSGTVSTSDGTGIYVPTNGSLITDTSTINVDGGTGIYIDGGSVDVGNSGLTTFNFGSNGGIAIYNNSGSITLGSNLAMVGSGSLVGTSNGNIDFSGNISVGEGGTGLLGSYDSSGSGIYNITNSTTGVLTATDGGIAIALINDPLSPYTGGSSIIAENQGTISVSGVSSSGIPSIGIYTEVSGVSNTGTISVGSNGVGIYTNYGTPSTESIDNQNMVMTGTDGIGMYLNGEIGGVVGNNITSTGTSNTGVILSDVGTTGTLNLGNITLNDDSLGVLATGSSVTTIDGDINIGNGSTDSSIGVVSTDGADTTLGTSGTVTAGVNGIGIYVNGASSSGTVLDATNVSVGEDGIHFLNNGGTLNITSGSIVANNNVGVYSNGGQLNYTSGAITATNGGIGMYIKGSVPTGNISIDIQDGRTDKYSIGAYYDGVVGVTNTPTINQIGSYSIGLGFDNGSTFNSSSAITLGGGNNQVGITAKNASTVILNNDINIGSGDNNIGIYSEDSNITVNGDISVASPTTTINSTDPLEFSPVGTFLKGSASYFGTGDITLGSNAIGVFGKELTSGSTISQTGDINGGSGSLGLYGEGNGTGTESVELIGDVNLDSGSAIGVFGKNAEVEVTGDMNIGADTSVGIASVGNGDITYSGDSSIDNSITTGSIGIYKQDGSGDVDASGNFNVGKDGYGIYVRQTTGESSDISYRGNMILGEAGIGIYSEGANVVTNKGTISVGATTPGSTPSDIDGRLNSVGMYLSDGSTGINKGILNADEQYSLGVYATGVGTTFSNEGTMNVSDGGIGVLARNGAVVTNEVGATINLNDTGVNSNSSIGMAVHSESSIINNGTINATEGIGMFVGSGATLTNTGTINVGNGIGIDGSGDVSNSGTINIIGTGSATNIGGGSDVNVGSVNIASDGTVTINENYISIGGTLQTQGNLVVDGSYVDVTTGTPVFSAETVTGDVEIMGDFAATGNGITYQIKDFVTTASGIITGSSITPTTSPLFLSKVANDGSLIIVKRPYSDLTIGDQFVEMEDSLDEILENDPYGDDGMALKSLNAYLEDLPTSEFEAESTRALSEMRGDIYSTIQQRMSDVERSFDTSFNELLNSYNTSRDVGKFSLITSDRDYNDPTVGVTDYDLTSIGFLYMNEFEGNKIGAKSGYTIGFTSNDFDFDDEGSEEKIYSIRVGVHKVTPIKDYKTKLITKAGIGYNRHETDRDFLLDQKYENEARYNSYSVSLDNKLSHSLILDLSSRLDVYGALNLEAAKIDDFDESGTLELDVDSNDYISSKAIVGVEGSKKFYVGKKISLKFSGGVNYSYEFADNANDNSAKISESSEEYYDLISPEEEKGILTGLVGVTLEKGNHMGVTLGYEVEDDHSRDEVSESYGLRFNYKF